MKYWGTLALNILLLLVYLMAFLYLTEAVFKSRTLLFVIRACFHMMLPFITLFCLINFGPSPALISLFVWILGLALMPFYVRIERRAERVQIVESAKSGHEPIMYLRSFAAVDEMRGIENLLEASAISYEASDYLRFQLNPIALGHDDRTGFPKLSTPDTEWWQEFKDLAAKSAAIFLLPIVAYADPKAAIVRETAHVLLTHPEKLIVIVPDVGSWQCLPRAPGKSFDVLTKWNEVRDNLNSVRPLVGIPDYIPSGFIFHLSHSRKSDLKCHRLPLSPTGLKVALSEVTRKRMQESKQARRDFETKFKELNGVSYADYYSQPGKKFPPKLPL
jgi:hypothetical protein